MTTEWKSLTSSGKFHLRINHVFIVTKEEAMVSAAISGRISEVFYTYLKGLIQHNNTNDLEKS